MAILVSHPPLNIFEFSGSVLHVVISSSMDTFRKAKIRLSGDDEVLKVRVSGELYVVLGAWSSRKLTFHGE